MLYCRNPKLTKMELLPLPIDVDVETKAVLKKTALAHKALAELKGVISSIPNENILIETLTLREARDSSAIENIISTFDEVYPDIKIKKSNSIEFDFC